MESMEKIREAAEKEEETSGAGQTGALVMMIARESERAAELIAKDLDNPEMSFQKCFEAIKAYARKHAKNGFWGCLCTEFDLDNPLIKVITEFYKIPEEWFQSPGAAGPIDLLGLI